MERMGAGGDADRERLTAIAGSADAPSLAHLAGLLPPRPAVVVDLGCGTGSVAVALARARSGDTVVALDRDTTLLPPEPERPVNLHVVREDLREWAPPRPPDAVHARFVLAHLPERDATVGRVASWPAPGGSVTVTEPLWVPDVAEGPLGRVLEAYRRVAEGDGLDFTFAHRVPELMTRAGLVDVTVALRAVRLGGGPGVDRWAALVERVAHRLDVDSADLEEFRRATADPLGWTFPQIVATVSGTVPARPGTTR